jgi:hypothetical protein
MDQLLREGHYTMIMDFSGLENLSLLRHPPTAGFAIQNFEAIKRKFSAQSSYLNRLEQILKLVGMSELLTAKAPRSKKTAPKQSPENSLQKFDYKFNLSALDSKTAIQACLFGQPELLLNSAFKS